MLKIHWVKKYYIEGYILMSDYPIWWDTTITIFNKFEDPQTNIVTWYKTVVNNCFWKNAGNKVNVNQVVIETDNTICRIPQQLNFMEKYQWINLPNDQMGTYFTLGPGDIIVKGEVSDIINEYSAGHRSSDLLTKYKALQGCIEIQQCAINTGIGRNNPHYYVRGK